MKAFGLAVLLLCLNYMCGIVAVLPIGLTSVADNTIEGKISYADLEAQLDTNATAQVSSGASGDWVEYAGSALNLFFNVIWRITFGLPAMLASAPFSLPLAWVTLFGVVNVIVYTVGAIELFRGITLEWG